MEIQWETQKITARHGKYFVVIERKTYDGRYSGYIEIWDEHKGYSRYGVFSRITLEDSKKQAEDILEILGEVL